MVSILMSRLSSSSSQRKFFMIFDRVLDELKIVTRTCRGSQPRFQVESVPGQEVTRGRVCTSPYTSIPGQEVTSMSPTQS